MAYVIEVGDIILVTVEARLNNQQVMTLFPWRVKSGTSADGKGALSALNAVLLSDDGLVDTYQKCMSEDVKQVRVKSQKIHPNRFAYIEQFSPNPNGLVAQDMMGPNTAVVVTRKGDGATRHDIGNVHLYGVPKSFTTDGEVNGTGTVAYNALQVNMTSEVTFGLAPLVIEPIIFNRTTPSASHVVTSAVLQFPLRVMRRRTVGLGS